MSEATAPEQRTPEWFAKRCGKFTGSRFVDVLAVNGKGEPLKAYSDLIWMLVVERLTNVQQEGPDSYAMRWGREVESFARMEYELATGLEVEQIDFVDHPVYSFVGCSPDGLVEDGGLEMKCPKDSRVHLERFYKGIPEEYIPQVQGSMWVTGRKWWDFVSYDPRYPEDREYLRLYRQRIYRDESFIARLEKAVLIAEGKVRTLMQQYSPAMIEKVLAGTTNNQGERHE